MNATVRMEGPGELLAGKYRVERVLGEGGMGVVLAATNEALNRKVAIKLLREGVLDNVEARKRFEREGRAAATLKSVHVAAVLDLGTLPDGRPFMVLEMLDGCDLSDVIDKGPPLPVGEAVDYVLQACEAIAEAHNAGIVHRDLKPKNLFLTRTVDGRPLVKVLDFGISKVEGDTPADMQLTRTTEVIGSPSYMSPEQLRSSRNVDARTDIWALGVILYELLTQRLPFYAHTVTELVLVVATEREPSARTHRADIPAGLDAVVSKCLAKKVDDRFQTVAELAAALAPYAESITTTAAERVFGVAARSGRSLQPSSGKLPDTGSRISVNVSSTVAWGETQREPTANVPLSLSPPPRRGRPLVAALIGVAAFAVVTGGAGLWYTMRRAPALAPVAANESIPLPPGRKDLPPIESAAPDPPAPVEPAASASASSLPETRALTPPKARPGRPATRTGGLEDIGRK